MRVRFPIFIAVLLSACLSSEAADWGSIRGNNAGQSHMESREATHSFSQPRAQQGFGERSGAVISRGRQVRSETEVHRVPPTGREFERHSAEDRIQRSEIRGSRPDHWRAPVIIPERERERRRWDIESERRQAYFWSRYHSGMIIGALPLGFVSLYVSGTPYYYYEGVYYEPGASGYIVVPPPIGANVPELPPGAEAIQVGQTTYYYAAGAFYVQQPNGFLVVVPPPGITVPYLPPGAVQTWLNGQLYYRGDGTYFVPAIQDGATVYLTTQP